MFTFRFNQHVLWPLIMLFLSACSDDAAQTPEQQVKEVLEKIELAAEERSLSRMMEHVSEEYLDRNGNAKQDIQRYAQMQFIARQNINIFSIIRSLDIIEGVAAVEMSTAMAGRDVDLSKQVNRLRAETIKFSIVLEQETNNWLITNVTWQQGW